jgi:uncharacterized protein DUF4129
LPAGLGRRAALLPLVAAFLILAISGVLAVPARAADDSNAGQLIQVPTVSPQQLGSALSTLSQGTNDTQLQQLLTQFQSQLSSGNNSGAASTLIQLKGLSASQGSGASQSLSALLQSLSVGSNGATVNADTLASLLNAVSGSQPGASSKSQQKLSVDMQSLANLMQYANATMASQLLQNSALLSQSAFAGSNPPVGAPVSLPGVSGIPGLSVPSVGAPSLSVGTPSGGLPAISLAAFAIPLLVVAAVAALFFSRGRVTRLVGTQSLPGMSLLRGGHVDDEGGAPPTDPRKKIEFYFGKAVRLMARRGVPKDESETHREFSSKCEATPEREQVTTISSLYEKAKFSGEAVEGSDAYVAAASFMAMEKAER